MIAMNGSHDMSNFRQVNFYLGHMIVNTAVTPAVFFKGLLKVMFIVESALCSPS